MNEYDYELTTEEVKQLLPMGFQGNVYRLSNHWTAIIPITIEKWNILEIGCYHGANVCSLMKTYAQHPETQIHCLDPWNDYEGYDEYQHLQPTNYSTFLRNITKLDPKDLNKIYIHRGLSHDLVPTFRNEEYDLIYIDGNHALKYVLEDAVECFRKTKKQGWMVFDDLQCTEVNHALSVFLQIYSSYFDVIQTHNGQLFLHKK
jgi:hypothetical protein